MSPQADRVLEDALRLSDRERGELAAVLIDSLDRQQDDDAESAWDEEIARRLAELDNGTVTPVPWSEARRQILESRHGSSES